ncbi:Zinc finger CCHC domain-containing protein 12 [Bienertia sinuspersici]
MLIVDCAKYFQVAREFMKSGRTMLCSLWTSGAKHACCKGDTTQQRRSSCLLLQLFSGAMYKAAYESNILPIVEPKQWPEIDVPKILPPPIARTVGRPPRNRKRQPGEPRKGKRNVTIRCSKCKEFGHNKTSCMGGLTKKEKKAAANKRYTKNKNSNKGSKQKSEATNDPTKQKKKGGRKPKKQHKFDAIAASTSNQLD